MTKGRKSSLSGEVFSEGVFTEPSFLFDKGFGEMVNGKLWLFPEEAVFLAEQKDIDLGRNASDMKRFFSDLNYKFLLRYAAYSSLREKGYVVKSGAKYGADFRVYEKGVKPSRMKEREHSNYLVWVLGQDEPLEMKTLVGINRVAHSTKKKLVLAVVDKEMDTTFINNSWVEM